MNNSNNNSMNSIPKEFDYDDGVVCFGTVTEIQKERFKRLPRHTILPSDILLSQSFLDSNEEDDNEGSVGTAQSPNNFAKENKTGALELKQSFVDDSAVFSSPNVAEFIPSTKLLDTEVVNKYIFADSISSSKSFSYLNDEESDMTLIQSIQSDDCEQMSIPHAIGKCQIKPEDANNICTLKHCSLKGEGEDEDGDTTIFSDSEVENTSNDSEDSIIVEKYSVTPGKQRLYDVRLTKPLFHTKTSGTSVPFMDRIDEAVVPVTKLLNIPSESITSMNTSVGDTEFDDELCTSKHTKNNTINLNNSLNETTKNIVSEISVETTDLTDFNKEESNPVALEITSMNTSVGDTEFDDELCTSKLSTNNTINLNNSLNETTNQIEDVVNTTYYKFHTKDSINNLSNISVQKTDFNKEESNAMDLEITSMSTSVGDTESNDELCTSKLSKNNSINLNNSLNETTNQIEDVVNTTYNKFNTKESINNLSNISVQTTDSTYFNKEETNVDLEITSVNTSVGDTEFDDELCSSKLLKNNINLNNSLNETTMIIVSEISVQTADSTDFNIEESNALALEITSMNTNVGDTEFDDDLCTNKLSKNNSINLNNSLNETTNQIENVVNTTYYKFDTKESINNLSNISVQKTDFIKEESSAVDLEITSIKTSVGDTESNDELCSSKLSKNNSINLNNSLNETAVNIVSEISVQATDLTHYNDKDQSNAVDFDITPMNTSVWDTELDDELCTSKLSTNNSINLNNSLNETTNQIENVVNTTYYKFDTKESINNLSNISVQKTDFIKEESSAVDLEITSIKTSVGDTELDDELCTSKLSTNNTINLNNSLNETTNQIEDVINTTYYKFDTKDSINNLSYISVQKTDFNKEESNAMDLEITSMNTSVGDTEFDNELCSSKLSKNNSINLNNSLNETTNQIENVVNTTYYKFDTKDSINNLSNISVQKTDFNKEESNAMDLEITSMNISVGDTEFDNELCSSKLSKNNFINLNNSLNETAMNIVSEISVETTDLTVFNKEESNAVDLEITSMNTSVRDTEFDDKLCTNKLLKNNSIDLNNSFNETTMNIVSEISVQGSDSTLYTDKDESNAVDLDITSVNTNDVIVVDTKFNANKFMNDIPNISASDIINETSPLFEVGNNTLKDIFYTDEKHPTCSNDISNTKSSSQAMRQYLDFEQAVYEMCNETNSGNLKMNDSILYDSQTRENYLLTEKTEGTYNTTKIDDSFSSTASPLKYKLSVINENQSLEENSSDFMMQMEDFDNPINNMSNLNNKRFFVAENVSEPEVVTSSIVNEIEKNTTEMEIKSNKGVCINNSSICSELLFVDSNDIHNISLDKNINEPKLNINYSISSNKLLNKDIQPVDSLCETENMNNSLDDHNKIKQMFNFGEVQNVSAVETNCPKTQKILDFSIVQQTPIFKNLAKKQKLLNFSIVDQTPIPKSTQTPLYESFTKNKDSFIDLSSVNRDLELKTESIDEENYQNCFYDSSLKNLSTMSDPAIESFTDDSINSNQSTINQSISENNFNQSTHSYEVNKLKTNVVRNNMGPIEYCIKESLTEGVNSEINCESNNSLNQNSRKLDCTPTATNFIEQKMIKSNKNIVDFSFIENPMLHTSELTNITSVESSCNISHLIDSCVVSMTDTKPKEQLLHSSENPITAVTSNIKIKESLADISDYCNIDNSTVHIEQSIFSHNSEPLIQMSDVSIFMEAEKSSSSESFHSIELDHIQEFNKRKIEAVQDYHNNENKIILITKNPESDHVQEDNKTKIKSVCEYHNNEKKMKVESEEPKTPISKLYQIKNMFKSNEKFPHCINNSKSENRLNFNKYKDNNLIGMPNSFNKPVKISKIPCKVTDTSVAKKVDFNNSLSVNNSIKSKKTIPKLKGSPALSDLSNIKFPRDK